MSYTVADFMLSRLSDWGASRIYGYPGDGINGILGAFERAKDRFSFIQARHEEEAAFMATAHAKFTGEVGICLATSGPGAIHLLNGLYDAKLDHQPVLAIVGQSVRAALGGNFQQEVDLHSLFKDVASNYVQTCAAPVQMRHLVDRAMRIALAERCVTCLIVPNDVQELPANSPPGSMARFIPASATRLLSSFQQKPTSATPQMFSTQARRSPCSSEPERWPPAMRSFRSPIASAPASPRPCSDAQRCRTTSRLSPGRSDFWAPVPPGK
jgi:thiamine pyrophosphate-dependent acetolactate synthase large subunit-like protein